MVTVAQQVGTYLARLGVGQAFGVVGSANFEITNAHARLACLSSPHATKVEQPPWPMPTPA